MLNPAAAFFKAKAAKDTFLKSHPEFPGFLRAIAKKGLRKGSVLTVRVAPPDSPPLETTVILTEQDAQCLAALMDTLGI